MAYLNEAGLTYLKRRLSERFAALAKRDGIYPGLIAGNLTDAAQKAREEVFLARPAGGGFPVCPDSRARIRRILGNTVIENQLFCPVPEPAGAQLRMEPAGRNRLRLTGRTEKNTLLLPHAPIRLEEGHRYYFCAGGTALEKIRALRAVYDRLPPLTEEGGFRSICTARANTVQLQLVLPDGTSFSEETLSVALVDLTRYFGAGREPQTVSEARRRFPEDPDTPEAGRFRNFRAEAIRGAETLPLPVGTYFPEGMRVVGDVSDELDARCAVTRIGSWDLPALLSTLRKESEDPNDPRYSAAPADPAPDAACGVCSDRLSGLSLAADGRLLLELPALPKNDVETARHFLEELDPVIHYVLAVPRVTRFSEPIPMEYAVRPDGEETVLPTRGAPLRAEIRYERDFTRRLAELDRAFVSVETLDELLRTLGETCGGTFERRWDGIEQKWRITFR